MWNKNQRAGNLAQAKGKVEQVIGDLAASDRLKAEAKNDEAVGKAEAAVGRAQKTVGAAIERVGKAVKR
jgi:uncharacterized protein YjbJ (UPF0337 family)